jgi:Transposase IS116/IS110/IS902 family
MHGVAFIVAVTVAAEVGDFARFPNPRQLMAYLGLVPSEHSTGSAIRRGGITKAGNALARRALIEGAWTYRMQARISRKLHDRIEGVPAEIREIAWKAQVRLCTVHGGDRQDEGRHHYRHCQGDGRLPLGNRSTRASGDGRRLNVTANRRPGQEAGHGGEPSCLAMGRPGSADARHLVGGSPETKPRSCGNQPANESLPTVVSDPASCLARHCPARTCVQPGDHAREKS